MTDKPKRPPQRFAKKEDLALTAQQEHFCRAMAENLTQADAYREAYPRSVNRVDKVVHSKASTLMRDGRIKVRVEALRAPAIRKVALTVEDHLEQLAKIRDRGMELDQISAAATAEIARGKVGGFYIERKEIKVSKFDDLGATEKLDLIEVMKAEAARRKALAGPDQGVTDVEAKGG